MSEVFGKFPEYIKQIFELPKQAKKFSIQTKEKIRKLNFTDNYFSLKKRKQGNLFKKVKIMMFFAHLLKLRKSHQMEKPAVLTHSKK